MSVQREVNKRLFGQRERGTEEVREKGRNGGIEEGKNKKRETRKCK